MPQLSDPTHISLDQAADLVAFKASLGFSRAQLEKRAMHPGLTGALIGGGLGLGTGLLSSAMSNDEDKNWGHNALMGTLLGAGVGGAAGMASPLISNVQGKGGIDPAQDWLTKMREAKKVEMAQQPPIQDHVGGFLSSLIPGSTSVSNVDPKTLAEGRSHSLSDAAIKEVAPGTRSGWDDLGQYTGRMGDTMAGGAIGAGVGHAADVASRNNVNVRKIRNMTPEQIKGLGGGVGTDVSAFQTAANAPGASVLRPGRGTGPSIMTPQVGAPASINTMPLNKWQEIQTQYRNQARTPRMGKAIGGLAGMAMAPAVSRTISRLFGPQAPITP